MLKPKAEDTTPTFSLPDCPSDLRSFFEDTSLESLVYWKLQLVFEKMEFVEQPSMKLLKTITNHVEKPLLALILQKTKGNQSIASKFLGLNRNTLHRKLKEFVHQPKSLRKNMK